MNLIETQLANSYLLDIFSPTDINECSRNNGGCNHHCMNTEGAYQCECIGGFSLLGDGITCAGKGTSYVFTIHIPCG